MSFQQGFCRCSSDLDWVRLARFVARFVCKEQMEIHVAAIVCASSGEKQSVFVCIGYTDFMRLFRLCLVVGKVNVSFVAMRQFIFIFQDEVIDKDSCFQLAQI